MTSNYWILNETGLYGLKWIMMILIAGLILGLRHRFALWFVFIN